MSFVEENGRNHQSLEIDGPPIRKVLSDESLHSNRITIGGFTNPLRLSWFFSVVGSEYCHTYFWIAKDLAWMQSWRHYSIFFGLMALGWSLLILYHAMRTSNWHELWNFVALFLWLFANFWWMIGEAHDYEYPEEFPIATIHSDKGAVVLQVALAWLLVYYMVLLPCNLLQCNKASMLEYDDNQLKPRSSCFKNFRQYENLHMLFWIAKDLAWNRLNLGLWLVCLVPTVLIAADFIIISAFAGGDDLAVDVVHFSVILLWVLGNSVWAIGDFFFDDYDEPMRMWIRSEISLKTARWYSSWVLFSAVVPILIMYAVWGSLTISGRLKDAAQVSSGGGGSSGSWIELQDIDGMSSTTDSGNNSPQYPSSVTNPAHNVITVISTGSISGRDVVKSRSNSFPSSSSNMGVMLEDTGPEPDEFSSLLQR